MDDRLVTFTREALFTMLGEVAMPPRACYPTDANCAEIGKMLVAKVEEYRVKGPDPGGVVVDA